MQGQRKERHTETASRRHSGKGPQHPPQDLWISGINPVREALRADRMVIREMILARTDQRVQELMDWAKQKGIALRHETREFLSTQVGHDHHQGVALRANEYPYASLESILEGAAGEREPVIILDCIQDPQNFGALLRSACFLGAKAVVIPSDRSARVTAAVIKVAAGATSYIPIVQATNLTRVLETLKESGLWIVGLDVAGNQSLYEADLSLPLGLVVGNEQKGLRPLVRKHCDFLVQIPVLGPIQSLNAAAAGAIALAEVQRQRLTKRK
ncbi:23S rRNA (guanosine(2251)-2'-O)-methyltransferase RlmB [Desulforhabdus amnigena]|nr:23S rRNA (guanosine(2251)-2'-O)-methyltransferase RlmB [Desulforhabdus amnigena]NLJ27834.1 23S rRNA (guanosine(2251)-2'-O)-methyltransferase RlmB [Deltaproteobacteria bacterium]